MRIAVLARRISRPPDFQKASIRGLHIAFKPPATARTQPLDQPSLASAHLSPIFRRSFHPSRRRNDVFFVALPALKSSLLNITRFSLLFLPFIWRYRLWKKYKKTSYLLIQLPIFALCIVFALGLDQSPSGRWRLLLMSENEEMAWARRKHQDVLTHDGALLLPPEDPQSKRVARVASRLVTALEEQQEHIVCDAAGQPRSSELGRVISEREASHGKDHEHRYRPSGVATSSFMPFRPASSNPLKKLETPDWNLYVIDLPQLNAFALPSRDIFVYTGLLKTLPDDDAMLAAVLAHEMAHVTERHSVENLGFLNVAAVGFDVLRGISFALTISFPFITDSAGVFINWLNDIVAQRAFSRKLEIEADAVGMDLMAVAGYDPRASLDLWELMGCVEDDAIRNGQSISIENRFALLRTHPTSEDRQKALHKDLDGAMRLFREHAPRRKEQAQRAQGRKETQTAMDAQAGEAERKAEGQSAEPSKEAESV